MKAMIFDSPQGSDAWHQFRAEHFGASEAAAAMGISKYTSRAALLHQKATGIMPEVSPALQAVFNRGHETEIGGRAMAEEIIGEDLFPATYYIGKLSSSCDGLTMMGNVALEHKQHNAALAEKVRNGLLPQEHYPQCQQVMLVTGAEKTLFMVSDGTQDNCAWMWVEADADFQAQIIAVWEEFEKDLSAYTPPEVIQAAVAAPIMALPALTVQVNGAITITDNLAVFGEKLQSFIGGLNTRPDDDQGFADIEAAVKVLQKAQDALEASEANALAQVASVDELRRTVKLYIDMARDTRLMLDKVVKQRKDHIRSDMVSRANGAFRQHIERLESETMPIKLIVPRPDFALAAKNKRTLASLRDAIDTVMANAKIQADEIAREIRIKIDWFGDNAENYRMLFADLPGIIYKEADDFKLVVQTRIADHKTAEAAKLERERQRIQADEEKKAEAKVRAEQAEVARLAEDMARAKAEVLAQADRERQAELKSLGSMEEWPVEPGLSNLKEVAVSTPKQPSSAHMIEAVAVAFGVAESTAADWLINEFQQRAA